jgi:hypothetical protein
MSVDATANPDQSFYDLTAEDLPHHRGLFSFVKQEFYEDIRKYFPKYDPKDPGTYPMITAATIRASLGCDYTGKEPLPRYVAYPPKIMQLHIASLPLGTIVAGVYDQDYPHNFDANGTVRKDVGMTSDEYRHYVLTYPGGSFIHAERAAQTTRHNNMLNWLRSELAEERREKELAKSELQCYKAAINDLCNLLHTSSTRAAPETRSTVSMSPRARTHVNANIEKRKARDSNVPEHGNGSSKKIKTESPTPASTGCPESSAKAAKADDAKSRSRLLWS